MESHCLCRSLFATIEAVTKPHNFAFAFAPFSYKTLRKKIIFAASLMPNERNDERYSKFKPNIYKPFFVPDDNANIDFTEMQFFYVSGHIWAFLSGYNGFCIFAT